MMINPLTLASGHSDFGEEAPRRVVVVAPAPHTHQEYDCRMSSKVRKTLTLDPEIVAALGEDPSALSATVNTILAAEIDRRQRRAALAAFADRLDTEFGSPDPAEVERFTRLLS
jgi:hypothetical protein